MAGKFRDFLSKILPASMWRSLSLLRWRAPHIIREWRDVVACAAFLCATGTTVSWRSRALIVKRLYSIRFSAFAPHKTREIVRYIQAILSIPPEVPGVLVEAGCYKGMSTAKFSLAAQLAGRELVVFDSFQGIPENAERHDTNIFGGEAHFAQGDYCGSLDEVKANVAKYGKLDCCRFVEGWFEDTLPNFNEKIAAVYLDVDLASSTRTCLKHFYPLLEPGGVLFSQDGHLPLVIEVFEDDEFWLNTVGCSKPLAPGLGKEKLLRIEKPA